MPDPPLETTIPLRVRYSECDPQRVAHHSAYAVWLEIARTELLRQQGFVYAQLERDGLLGVIARLNVRYRKPAFYDDQLNIHVRVRVRGVKVEHDYTIHRDHALLATAQTTLLFTDRTGKIQPVPADLPGVE